MFNNLVEILELIKKKEYYAIVFSAFAYKLYVSDHVYEKEVVFSGFLIREWSSCSYRLRLSSALSIKTYGSY